LKRGSTTGRISSVIATTARLFFSPLLCWNFGWILSIILKGLQCVTAVIDNSGKNVGKWRENTTLHPRKSGAERLIMCRS
jgi:hypothetical protein